MLDYRTRHFSDLNCYELYALLLLRQKVFIVEQNCPYLDCDDKDQNAFHILGYNNAGQMLASCRLLDAGVSYPHYVSIGRVVTDPSIRQTGEGRHLMTFALTEMERIFPGKPIKISSQSYIAHFYESFGFYKTGEPYLEDDIPHIAMIFNK